MSYFRLHERLNSLSFVILLGVAFQFSFVTAVWSLPLDPLEDLNKKALSLRNTDPDIQKSSEWLSLAKQISSRAKSLPKNQVRAKGLHLSAVLFFDVFKNTEDPIAFDGAMMDLVTLLDGKGCYEECDDALLLQGDLFESAGKSSEARDSWLKLRNLYPDSELAIVAGARLSKKVTIEEGETPSAISDARPIVIDPGHGGEDLGAVGVGGLLEKDVTLALSNEVAFILRRYGYSVKLTRESDQFVPLAERTSLANELNAVVFVSIHTNASPKKNLYGTETYILDNSDNEASIKLAERENASRRFEEAPGDLDFILSDLIQTSKLPESFNLATIIQGRLVEGGSANGTFSKDLGVRKAPFYVLVGAHMPSVLVETAFIDHPQEGLILGDKKKRSIFAQARADGIRSFLAQGKE